jgi:hypothetical protein
MNETGSMVFTKDFGSLHQGLPEMRMTITNQDAAHVEMTLYTCYGTQPIHPHWTLQHRTIQLLVPITAGASPEVIANDVMEASHATRAVGVRWRHQRWEPVALAPCESELMLPRLWDADRWAKDEGLSLALPAWDRHPSLERARLHGLLGKWHVFVVR